MTNIEFVNQFEPLDLPIYGVRLPVFIVEEEHKKLLNISENISNYDFLRKLCLNGFRKLKLEKHSEEYKKYTDRVKYELKTIQELGFVDYILLVWDVINFCNVNEIPTGYGRGSAAGSLILYLIGVTKIDPIKYNLFFERFISKTRAKKQEINGITYLDGLLMCDIDLDICFYKRPQVISYLENKFGNKICKILTFNTLSSKLLIKECGKAMTELSDEQMTSVTELIPKKHGKVYDVEEAYQEEESFRKWCDAHKEIYDISCKLRNLIKNKGVHPSAISISFDLLSESTPTEFDSEKNIVSSYDMDWISLFNIKLDVLGLRGVSVVNDVCKNVQLDMSAIDFHNPVIYQQLQDFKTPHGIFQLEAETNYRVASKIKPRNLEELSAVIALARPGALQFVDKFANYTNFNESESIHPFFDDILKSTAGACIYQEQLLQMAHKIGFTLEEAEILRRIVGKKKTEEVKAWKEKISEKVKANKLDPVISDILWKILEDSASYSFNKCLSLDTVVETLRGNKMLFEVKKGDMVKAYDPSTNSDHFVNVVNKYKSYAELFEVELEDGRIITCSKNHKLMCEDKQMRTLEEIITQNYKILCN